MGDALHLGCVAARVGRRVRQSERRASIVKLIDSTDVRKTLSKTTLRWLIIWYACKTYVSTNSFTVMQRERHVCVAYQCTEKLRVGFGIKQEQYYNNQRL